jgi:two-component system, LytTR family, response regulator
MKIKAVIVEDELRSRETLTGLLRRYCSDTVEIVAESDGCVSGLVAIKSHQPDVVFLDIQMPDGSGFKLLEELDEINFEVVFTTAYDQFAIKAIRYSALDYLLKPIVPAELKLAVQKVLQKKGDGTINKHIRVLLENMKEKEQAPKKIVLSTSEGMHVIDVRDIIRCESDDYYTRFFIRDRKPIMVSKTLKEHEELLSGFGFIRPHKSHLVNVHYIRSFVKNDNGYLLLTDGTTVPVSRRKREKIQEELHHL